MYGIGRKRQAFAGLYALDGRALVFAQQGIAMACDTVRPAALDDPEGLGDAVFAALDASTPLRKKSLTLGEQARAFADEMDAFRHTLKAGQRRFTDNLAHVAIRQTPDGITLTPMRATRGRFAFERGGEDHVIDVPASLDAAPVGRALVKMLMP